VKAAPGLFSGKVLEIGLLHALIPRGAAAVKAYQPKGYTANFAGVPADSPLRGKDALVPMETLEKFFERLDRLAALIATQA
jgi:hypothetical protein